MISVLHIVFSFLKHGGEEGTIGTSLLREKLHVLMINGRFSKRESGCIHQKKVSYLENGRFFSSSPAFKTDYLSTCSKS